MVEEERDKLSREFVHLADDRVEPFPVLDPLLIARHLPRRKHPAHGLAVHPATPLPVGAVQLRRVGVAPTSGGAAWEEPFDQAASQDDAHRREGGRVLVIPRPEASELTVGGRGHWGRSEARNHAERERCDAGDSWTSDLQFIRL